MGIDRGCISSPPLLSPGETSKLFFHHDVECSCQDMFWKLQMCYMMRSLFDKWEKRLGWGNTERWSSAHHFLASTPELLSILINFKMLWGFYFCFLSLKTLLLFFKNEAVRSNFGKEILWRGALSPHSRYIQNKMHFDYVGGELWGRHLLIHLFPR